MQELKPQFLITPTQITGWRNWKNKFSSRKSMKCHYKEEDYSVVTSILWDLHSWRVEAHVVDSPAALVDPAVTQSLSQRLVGDVEADDQVQLVQVVQGPGLRQRPRETWTDGT